MDYYASLRSARHRAGDHSLCGPNRPRHGMCSKCGKVITVTPSSASRERIRCRECQQREMGIFTCANSECGREFTRYPSQVKTDFACCSLSCSTKAAIQRGLMPQSVSSNPGTDRASRHLAKSRARRLNHAETWDGISDEEILARDGWRCQVPGCKRRPIRKDLKYPHPRSKSIDHIVPLSLGGDDTAKNKRAAHLGCNMARGNAVGVEQLALFGSVREPPLATRIAGERKRVRKERRRRRDCECEGAKHQCFSRIYFLTCIVCGALKVSRDRRRTVCSKECRAKRAAEANRQRNDRLGAARGWPRGRGSYNVGREPWNKRADGAAA